MKLYAKKEIVRKYYKYTDEPNFTKVGNLSIVNGDVSNFSTSNYGILPNDVIAPNLSTSIEMLFKITVSNFSSSSQVILGNNTANRDCPQMEINTNKSFWFAIAQDSSTWVFVSDTTWTAQTNTTYWLKGIWDNGEIKFLYSLNGIDYTSIGVKTLSAYSWTKVPHLGVDITSTPFTGTMHLKECYIKIGNYVWRPLKIQECTEDDYDFYKDVGVYKTPKINNKYYASTQGEQ